MAEPGQMHANLVGAAAFQASFDQGGHGKALAGLEQGQRILAAPGRQGGPARRGPRSADGTVDGDAVVQIARHQRQVGPLGGVAAKLALQVLGGGVGAGEDHDPRGVPVEAVNDEQAPHRGRAPGQSCCCASQDRVEVTLPRRVHHHAGRLVDHHQVRIEVEDLDGSRGGERPAAGQVGPVRHPVGGGHPLPRIHRQGVVDEHVAAAHLVLRPTVRQAQVLLQPAGEALRALRHPFTVSPRVPDVGFGGPLDRERRGGYGAAVGNGEVEGVAQLLGRAIAAGRAPGWSALATGREGGGVAWAVGRAAIGEGPVTADLLFDLASLTKPLATTTLLLLARRDGLSLDAALGELLPELSASPWREVRIWHCLTHTAGFPAWEPLYALGDPSAQGYLETLARLEPSAPPGGRVQYSCLGFLVLGLVLERGFGAPLAELFAERVARPLGIAEELAFAPPRHLRVAGGQREPVVERGLLTARGLAATPPPPLAGAHSCDDGNARALGGAAGNAGLFGTVGAVARLSAEYVPGGGDLLRAAESELASRCWTEGLGEARGLGWQLAATPGCSAGPALPPDAVGHTGFTGTSVWIDRRQRRIFVLLGNRLHPAGRPVDLHPLRRRFHALAARVVEKHGDHR